MDAGEWDSRYASTELVWGREPNRFVVSEFAGLQPGRVLDLGCGEGRNAVWLAVNGWRATAVDFSSVAIDRGRELARAAGVEVDWVVADLTAYEPEPGRYDAVLIAYLHLVPEERSRVLRRAVAALAPGGHLVVIGHDLANLTEGVGGPQVPEILYTPEQLVADLDGLAIHRAERVRRPVQTDAGPVDAIDTVVHARRE